MLYKLSFWWDNFPTVRGEKLIPKEWYENLDSRRITRNFWKYFIVKYEMISLKNNYIILQLLSKTQFEV